jgi:hypothetical protein
VISLFRHDIREEHADLPITIHELQQQQQEYAAAATTLKNTTSPLAPPMTGFTAGGTMSPPTPPTAPKPPTPPTPATPLSSPQTAPSDKRRTSTLRKSSLNGDFLQKHHQVSKQTENEEII